MAAPVKTGSLITKIVKKKTIVTTKKAVTKKTLDKAHDEVQNVKLKIGGVVTITEPQKNWAGHVELDHRRIQYVSVGFCENEIAASRYFWGRFEWEWYDDE